jgi:hypothetical protein
MRKMLFRSFVPAFVSAALTLPAFAAPAAAAPTGQAKSAPATAVNINTASQAQLEALPGVGTATAKKIIAGRPYASVADLAKAGVSKSTISKISSMVTVGAATAPAAAAAPKPAATAPAAASAPKPAPAAAAPAPAAAATASAGKAASSTTPQQPPQKGMVWVNLSTKVFHREGDKYYGNTKNGKFMTEADAIAAGYHEAKKGDKKSKG